MPREVHGLWLVDKPLGITSHDAVARARRLLGTRQVGHAGTLDPMATGLLVLLVGEATKLSPFLSMERKRYRAEVRLGVGTTSLDADGAVCEELPLSGAWLQELGRGVDAPGLRAVLEQERDRREQIPPSVSDSCGWRAGVRAGAAR
jgi:tRNA pseudouridine55 synthase